MDDSGLCFMEMNDKVVSASRKSSSFSEGDLQLQFAVIDSLKFFSVKKVTNAVVSRVKS